MNEQSKNQKGKSSNKKPTKKPHFVAKAQPKIEVPMYDPQTGEPNYEYEKLTGKPNPLIELRKNSSPMIKQGEPKRKNRYLVKLPQHFAIPEYCIAKTSRPKLLIETSNTMFGQKQTKSWEEITFHFYDPIIVSVSESLLKIVDEFIDEPFTYTLEMLGPNEKVIETYEIGDCEITSIDLGDLAYASDDLAICKMTVKPGYVKLKT